VKLLRFFCILLAMAALSTDAAENDAAALAQDPRVARSLGWLANNLDWITDQHVRISEIPAPEFAEGARAAAYKDLLQSCGLKTRTDGTGNVIGERPGTNRDEVILLAAHLDTVFPAGTDVRVKRNGRRLEGPGIADNGAGLAALIAVARALQEGRVKTGMTIVFAGDVGEEGEGNLRGIRALVEAYGTRLRAVIAVDGAATDHVTTQALASRRIEATISGPGGHSWSDFGAPNPITALSRAIVKFSAITVPELPRTSFNFAMIEGGTSVNSIPNSASVKIDLRSEDDAQLTRLESALRDAVQAGVSAEMAASQRGSEPLSAEFKSLGVRPGGKLAEDSALLGAIRSVDAFLDNVSRREKSSTDANIPMSLGIPAISIGGGGQGGGSHSLEEWYDASERLLGLKRMLLTTLLIARVQP
jgi:acetylornithine deacetylase/succinyl-diaminopimelate desuccinylase-like protein